MEIFGPGAYEDLLNGKLDGQVATSCKEYKDAKTFFKMIDDTLADDTIMYEVYSYTKAKDNSVGKLNWGITVLKPILVAGECNMTRGHYHEDLECDEIYYCISGDGLLLMMDENGKCFAEKMERGSVHYINGHDAHRLINIGDVDLCVGACWPANSGHDYDRVSEHPFNVRIFKHDDKIVIEE